MIKKTPANLVKLLNKFANIDIETAAVAVYSSCTLKELPSNYKDAVNLTLEEHRNLILDLNQKKPKFFRQIDDFDLNKYLHYYDEEFPDLEKNLKWIGDFFKGRKVDVIYGKGAEKGDFEFDWILVLDPELKTLFSFILNLED
ncbi:MAG: hypothetical protein ACD_79C00014G0001 [uncultured bacterium]|nr:MAG: hypothetical protein ACD_79C00014G0001 [uncultured bacterium]